MTQPAAAADMATSFSSAKLIVSGSSAEQPSPASPKARTPAAALPSPRDAISSERGGEDERQQAVGAAGREPPLDRGEEHPAEGDRRPERGQR